MTKVKKDGTAKIVTQKNGFRPEVKMVRVKGRRSTESMKIRVNQGYDELIHISDITPNTVNGTLYGDITKGDRMDYIRNLAFNLIRKKGLNHPILMFKDKNIPIGGHHRIEALKLLGEEWIPIIRSDYLYADYKNKPASMRELVTGDNSNPEFRTTEWMSLQTVLGWIDDFEVEYTRAPKKEEIIIYAKTVMFSYEKYLMYKRLLNGYSASDGTWVDARSELLQDVQKGSHGLSWCVDTQKKDAQNRLKALERPQVDAHDNIITKEISNHILKSAQDFMAYIIDYTTSILGQNISLGADQDPSTLSGLIHGGVAHSFPAVLKQVLDLDAKAPTNNDHFDINVEANKVIGHLPLDIEIKATGNDYWTSGTEKIGYHYLVASDNTFTRWFAAYCYVPQNIWSGGIHGRYKLRKNALYKLNPTILHGDLKEDRKGNIVMHKDKLN